MERVDSLMERAVVWAGTETILSLKLLRHKTLHVTGHRGHQGSFYRQGDIWGVDTTTAELNCPLQAPVSLC